MWEISTRSEKQGFIGRVENTEIAFWKDMDTSGGWLGEMPRRKVWTSGYYQSARHQIETMGLCPDMAAWRASGLAVQKLFYVRIYAWWLQFCEIHTSCLWKYWPQIERLLIQALRHLAWVSSFFVSILNLVSFIISCTGQRKGKGWQWIVMIKIFK